MGLRGQMGLMAGNADGDYLSLPQQAGGFLQHLVRSTEGLGIHLIASLSSDQLREFGTDVDVRTLQRTALNRSGTA